MAAFAAARITRLCDCGCNSFDIEVPDAANVEPITEPGSGGCVFNLDFHTSDDAASLSLFVFVDRRGHFSGLDVDYCGNSFPVPEDIRLLEPPYHVHSSSGLLPTTPDG